MNKTREVYADENSAIIRLRRNGIAVDNSARLIVAPKVGPGIKLWGAIDYLKNQHKYGWGRR